MALAVGILTGSADTVLSQLMNYAYSTDGSRVLAHTQESHSAASQVNRVCPAGQALPFPYVQIRSLDKISDTGGIFT